MEWKRSEVERRLRKRLEGLLDPRDALVALSRVVLQAVEVFEPCFGYVISYRRLGIERKGYFVAVFLKTPGHRRLAVFDERCKTAEEGRRLAEKKLEYFSLYMYSSRYLLDPEWSKKNP